MLSNQDVVISVISEIVGDNQPHDMQCATTDLRIIAKHDKQAQKALNALNTACRYVCFVNLDNDLKTKLYLYQTLIDLEPVAKRYHVDMKSLVKDFATV